MPDVAAGVAACVAAGVAALSNPVSGSGSQGSGSQGQSQRHRKFEANLYYVRSCIKKQNPRQCKNILEKNIQGTNGSF